MSLIEAINKLRGWLSKKNGVAKDNSMSKTLSWKDHLENSNGLSVDLSETDIEVLPNDTQLRFRINLSNCKMLRALPAGLKTGSLMLAGCSALEELPEGLDVSFLDISDCQQIDHWPRSGKIEAGRLRARNCARLTELPRWMTSISQLDLRGCTGITELPPWLNVTSWIDVADTGIASLPDHLQGCGLRWKGVIVDERIAFRPDEISGREVLDVTNAELRRVMLERVTFERFLNEVDAETLDTDSDAGGERRLLRVAMQNDEPLVCVAVFCPSTDRQYVIRVPPSMTSCHQAIAWTAGFDDPALYKPLIET